VHFENLIRVLEKAHKDANLVHRDIKLSNFFEKEKGGNVGTLKIVFSEPIFHSFQILLNDWTFAMRIGEKTEFEGAMSVAPDDILELLVEDRYTVYPVEAWHDLEMVVKTVFQSQCSEVCAEIRTSTNPKEILAFWQYHLQPKMWQKMLQAARKCDYNGLIAEIQKFLPPLPPK
jgi:hypothetical protein